MKRVLLAVVLGLSACARPAVKKGEHLSAPIWAPFHSKLKACRPDCEPDRFGVYRPGDKLCHGVGAALDLYAMKCGDEVLAAETHEVEFTQLVECMREAPGEPRVYAIWHQCFVNCAAFDPYSYHYDHAHFSIGCPAPSRF